MDKVERIIFLERRISEDHDRWEQAQLIAELLEEGWTQRDLAAQVGKTKSHIGYMSHVWSRFGNLGCQERSSRTFDSYYKEVQRDSKKSPEPASEDTTEPGEGGSTGEDEDATQGDSEPPEDTEQDKRTKLIARLNEGMENSMSALKQVRQVSYTRIVDTEVERTLKYLIEEYTMELETVRKLK